jgi:hypothetical protein
LVHQNFVLRIEFRNDDVQNCHGAYRPMDYSRGYYDTEALLCCDSFPIELQIGFRGCFQDVVSLEKMPVEMGLGRSSNLCAMNSPGKFGYIG